MLTLTATKLTPARAGRQGPVAVTCRVQEKGAKHLEKSRPKKVGRAAGDARSQHCGGWSHVRLYPRPRRAPRPRRPAERPHVCVRSLSSHNCVGTALMGAPGHERVPTSSSGRLA